MMLSEDLKKKHPICEYVNQLSKDTVKAILKVMIKRVPGSTEKALKTRLINECFENADHGPLTYLKEIQRAMDYH